MPKVAIIGTRGYPSYYGGFETAVRKLAPHLAESGWDVIVYGRPGTIRTDDPTKDDRVKSVVTRGIEKKSLSTLTYGLTASVRAIRDGCDVALVMNVANGFWLPLLRLAGIPTLVNVDGIEWERAKWGRLAKAVFRAGARLTARWADTLIYDAIEIQRWWKDRFGKSGVFIPYGGDSPKEVADSPLGLPRHGYVLVVARFVPENTIPEFFSVVESLSQSWPVVIVGSSGYGGPLDAEAARLASANDQVQWLGHVSDDELLLGLMQNCGAYFHGHSVGGTNPALVQAMACGAPIVARNTVYNAEVLDGAGLLVAPDASSIEAGIKRMINDPELRRASSKKAKLRQADRYTWEIVVTRYEAEIRTALSARSL